MKFLFAYTFLFVIVFSAGAQTKEELQNRKQQAIDDIELTRQLIERASKQRITSVKQIQVIDRGIKSREKLIRTIESETYLLDEDISDLEQKIRDLSLREDRYRREYATIIYFVYKNHTEYEKIMYLLASNSISQAYQRYKYLKYIADYRKKLVKDIELLIEELIKQKEELNNLKNEKLRLLEEKENESRNLQRERGVRSGKIRSLQNEERRLKSNLREKERIAAKLEDEIKRIIEEEARKLSANNLYASLTPEQKLVSADFVKNKGVLPWPMERGIITLPFGNADFPGLEGTKINSNGVDISGIPGSKARAIFGGEVTKVFAILGANYTVLIRHGDFLTVYQNLVNVRVKTGDKVATKQVIGDIFSEENGAVATVHFAIWQEKKILNPEDWLSR